ncbi:MAG: T9SS type A sorting domain-containing protein [Cyclobacteriaceae bacterium]|jgi:hypothetical protein|nr:T9SS type A sorting domain-containing protein [Cyclobacteriaceae bacterium]
MKSWIVAICMLTISLSGLTQSFDLLDRQDAIQADIGETLRIPLKIRNNSEKAQFYIIRKIQGGLNSSQKGYFCLDNNCLPADITEFSKRIEPGETLQKLVYIVEGSLLTSQSSVRFQVFPRTSPQDVQDYSVAISINEKLGKPVLFHSKDITIYDVYPNPVQDQAFIDYQVHNENVNAKLIIHNILGRPLDEYELYSSETLIKIQTEDYTSGIYFYTLYVDNNGILTRKLIIRK